MSYQERVQQAIREQNELNLLRLIEEEIEGSDDKVKAKESAINGLAQLYVDSNRPAQIQ